MTERKQIRRDRKTASLTKVPITFSIYQVMFKAFLENPRIEYVARISGVSKEIAEIAINEGWPHAQMPALADRVSEARREANTKVDKEITEALVESAKIVRGVKLRVAQQFGQKFEGVGLNAEKLANMTPNEFAQFAKGLETLVKLEEKVIDKLDPSRKREDPLNPETSLAQAASMASSILSGLRQGKRKVAVLIEEDTTEDDDSETPDTIEV